MSGFNFDLNPQNFNFDAANFGLGVLAGWASAYALYRARHLLGAARENVSERATTAQEFASRSADARYIRDLTRYCESAHLAGAFTPLSNVIAEPRFIRNPRIDIQEEDEGLGSIFHVVPNVPDHPYLQAPYNIETMALEELDNGAHTIALLGVPGSGRTTALHAIALWSLGKVRFDARMDKVQDQLDQQERELSSDERARRIKQRLDVQNMARQGKGAEAEQQQKQHNFRQLTPIYAHLGNITISTGEFGRRIDPAEPLLRAAQQYVGRVTSMTLARNLYTRLNEGKALLLLDGFDDLPIGEQQTKAQWLKALIADYGHNFIIVSGPVNGYGPLLQAGLTPVFLRPWQDMTIDHSIDRLAKAWPKIGGARRRGVREPSENVVGISRRNNRIRPAFEITAKTWATFQQESETEGITAIIDNLLAYYLPNKPLDDLKPKLVQLARLQLDKGYITEGQMTYVLNDEGGDMPAPRMAADHDSEDTSFLEDDDDDDFLDIDTVSGSEDPFDDEIDDSAQAPRSRAGRRSSEKAAAATHKDSNSQKIEREYEKLITQLHRAGLLTRYRGNRYQFRHPLITAYFGSMAVRDLDIDEILQKANDPTWQHALAYAAAHTPMDTLVTARLNSPVDVLHDNVAQVSRWMGYLTQKARWRGEVLTALGNTFMQQNQYPVIRERAAAALVSTRDPNAIKVFEKGLKDKNADVRRLSCLGLGAFQEVNALDDLLNLMDNDSIRDVRLAAGMAVAVLNTDEALREIDETLTQIDDSSEILGRVLAEQLAANPEVGYEVLYLAAKHENMFLRRAAVFGLRRIEAPWATLAIYNVSLEDRQAYVKLAAESVFYDTEFTDSAEGVWAYPEIMRISWLRNWILSRGVDELELENLPAGENPAEYLLLALREAPDSLKALSLAHIGQLGLVNYAGVLYQWLGDRNRPMREAAHRALSDLQMQMGRALPLPV